jgi:hypothetical protein
MLKSFVEGINSVHPNVWGMLCIIIGAVLVCMGKDSAR